MKKLFFSSLVAVAAIGGAFASQNANGSTSESSKSLANHVYYIPAQNCRKVTCNDNPGPSCTSLGASLPTTLSGGSCSNPQIVIGNNPTF